jgi:hypothetical protein
MVPTARALLDSDGATIVLPNDVVLATLHPPAAAATAPAGPSEVRGFCRRRRLHQRVHCGTERDYDAGVTQAKPAGCCGDASPCGATTEQKEPAAATTSSARPWYDSLQIHGTSPLTPSCCSADAPCIPADIYGGVPPRRPTPVGTRCDCHVYHKWALMSTAPGPAVSDF